MPSSAQGVALGLRRRWESEPQRGENIRCRFEARYVAPSGLVHRSTLAGAARGWLVSLLHQLAHLRMLAEGFQAAVHEHSGVAFLAAGDCSDFGIAETLGPQVERFALAWRQRFDQQHE